MRQGSRPKPCITPWGGHPSHSKPTDVAKNYVQWASILLGLSLAAPAWAATGPADVVERLGAAPLGPGYEIHYGDGPSPDRIPESGWVTPPGETPWGPSFEAGRWTGVAWLRVRIQAAPAWVGEDLTLWILRLTPISMYLDGRKIYASGDGLVFDRIEAAAELVLDTQPHELTVRIEAPNLAPLLRSRNAEPLNIALGPTKSSTEILVARTRSLRTRAGLMVGAGGALGILHLLLFLFRRKQRANLYFAATSLAGATIGTLDSLAGIPKSTAHAQLLLLLFDPAVLLSCASGLRLMYELFHPKPAARGRLLLATSLLALLIDALVGGGFLFVFSLLLLLEQLRLVVVSNLQRRDGAWLLGIGMGALSVTGGAQIVGSVLALNMPDMLYAEGYIVLLISISTYLARSFAKTQDRLEAKLTEVESLSAHALAQERQLKEDEMRRALLEAENVRKEQELVEARKLQAVLDDLRQTQAELVHQQKMASLGGLVAGIAHELNSPIGAISSAQQAMVRALEKLKVEIGDAHEEESVQRILRSLAGVSEATRLGSERVDTIVKGLRRFAHLDEGSVLEVQLEDGVRDTLVVLENEINTAGVKIVDRMSDLPAVTCKASDINHVFLNVIRNAVEASNPGDRIELETSHDSTRVVVIVRDHGEGIATENAPHIFDPGFTTRGVGVGMGLGLSIAWKTVKAHGGDIAVDSELGAGTSVKISIPIEPVSLDAPV